jgi:twitching motility protein PilT
MKGSTASPLGGGNGDENVYQVPTQPSGVARSPLQQGSSTPGQTVQPSQEAKQQSVQVMKTSGMSMNDLLEITVKNDASDLHITVNYPIFIRIDGKLQKLGAEIITPDRAKQLIYEVLDDQKRELLEVNKEVDLSYSFQNKARFRINAYNERGNLAAAFRLIPNKIRSVEELQLPKILHEFTKIPQGLILVVGPTGHGKSTTLAAMIQEINVRDAKHIITIEDPIEYMYPVAKSLVDQRELHQDTHSWEIALRDILRQDPNVILVGEMRDFETIAATITAAETGHLVFATLHTNSAAQSVDRIIDVFPEHQQAQIRMQLANVLEAIVSQRLVPIIGGGRSAVCEVMVGTAAVRNAVREDKTYQIDNIIQTSADVGMLTLERALVDIVREGKITLEDAQNYTTKPEEVLRLVRK